MSYRQITSEERYILAALRTQGFNQSEIARHLHRHRSTICRELKRNSSRWDGHYRPSKAIERTAGRRSRSRRNQRFTRTDLQHVESLLQRRLSPEQISGRLAFHGTLSISHETIYRHVWRDRILGGSLYTYLRGARKKRRKRYGAYDSRGRLAGKRHISERPLAAQQRSEIGHWEIDTVIGKGSHHCLVTLVDRKTGYVVIGKLRARTKEHTHWRTVRLLRRHPQRFKTITADNGTEFHDYAQIERATGTTFYFATPHHSWERGTSENTNGLIRQYVPKGTSMTKLSQQRCNAIARALNDRPRKRLGFRTPQECFNEI
jgi:transposase, IS30 family